MFSGLIKDQKLMFAFTILVISIFIFLTTVVIVAYMLFSENKYVPFFLRPFIDYHVHFMLIMSIVGVFSGFSFYFLISYTLKKEKSLIKKTIELVRKFLSDDEKRVIDALLEKQGLITQSDVSRLFGFSRVKTHRVIKRLEKRGIVYIDKQGKINYVRLVNTFLESEP